jgi:hypothetical protein
MKVVMKSLQLSILFHRLRNAYRQAISTILSNLFPCSSVSTDNCFLAEKPYLSDRMMAHLFERIAPSWAQSETTMIFSRHKFAGRKYDVCSISEQNENEVSSANIARHDQRAFRCGFTRARRGRKNIKRSRVCFRQRNGGSRCVSASFQPSLCLHFT